MGLALNACFEALQHRLHGRDRLVLWLTVTHSTKVLRLCIFSSFTVRTVSFTLRRFEQRFCHAAAWTGGGEAESHCCNGGGNEWAILNALLLGVAFACVS